MFSSDQFIGMSLPERTLCLTFDDGPGETHGDRQGPQTVKIAEYLNEQSIGATFFMVGKFVAEFPHILSEVAKLGHGVGNHTYNHPDLQQSFKDGKDFIAEIKTTYELIVDRVPGKPVCFRAPYGRWAPEIARKLNENLGHAFNHIGPFHWDIDSKDWAHWRDDRGAVECARTCLNKIIRINRGIVLMHDSTADDGQLRMNNQTLETIKILVPQLKSLGYKFVQLDEVAGLPY